MGQFASWARQDAQRARRIKAIQRFGSHLSDFHGRENVSVVHAASAGSMCEG